MTFKSVLIVLVVCSVSHTVFAQKKGEPMIEAPEFTINEETSKVVYKGVQEEKGAPGILFDKALAWAMKYYKNPSSVIREKNKEQGRIKAKARFYIFYTDPKKGTKTRAHTIEYTLTLQFREGRYRYEITDIIYKATSYQGIEQWVEANNKQYSYRTASYLKQIDTELNKVINSFISAIAEVEKEAEDW